MIEGKKKALSRLEIEIEREHLQSDKGYLHKW